MKSLPAQSYAQISKPLSKRMTFPSPRAARASALV